MTKFGILIENFKERKTLFLDWIVLYQNGINNLEEYSFNNSLAIFMVLVGTY